MWCISSLTNIKPLYPQVVFEMQQDCVNGHWRVVTYREHWALNIVR